MSWNEATAPEWLTIQKNIINGVFSGLWNVLRYDRVVFKGSLLACSAFVETEAGK